MSRNFIGLKLLNLDSRFLRLQALPAGRVDEYFDFLYALDSLVLLDLSRLLSWFLNLILQAERLSLQRILR